MSMHSWVHFSILQSHAVLIHRLVSSNSVCVCVCVCMQLMQRIEAFMRLKRQQLDLANQIEFYQSREPGKCVCVCVETCRGSFAHAVSN